MNVLSQWSLLNLSALHKISFKYLFSFGSMILCLNGTMINELSSGFIKQIIHSGRSSFLLRMPDCAGHGSTVGRLRGHREGHELERDGVREGPESSDAW